MTVRNIISKTSDKAVANQFIITDKNKVVFQSYDRTICIIDFDENGADRVILGKYWNFSNTTSKYLYQFLNEILGWNANKKAVEIAIKNKDIIYNADLY